MSRLGYLLLITGTFFMASCSKLSHEDAIYFDDIRVPDMSQAVISLPEGEPVDFDCIGPHDFSIVDSLMFVSTMEQKGMLKIFDIASLSQKGAVLNMGQGPGEFTYIPELKQYNILQTDSGIVASIPDFTKGEIHDVNFCLSGDSIIARDTESSLPALQNFSMFAMNMGDGLYLIQSVNPMEWDINYILFKDGNSIENPALETINSGKVHQQEYLGTIMTTPIVNPKRQAVAFVNNNIPQINVVFMDGKTAPFTIAPDGEIGSYKELVAKQESKEELTPYYAGGVAFDDFFVMCRENKNDNSSELIVYDWDGNLLKRFNVPELFTSFDIDTANNNLYTFDFQNERMSKYSLPD